MEKDPSMLQGLSMPVDGPTSGTDDSKDRPTDSQSEEVNGDEAHPNEQEPDGLDFIDPIEINDGVGVECELHVYENRYDARNEEVLLRVGVKQEFEAPKDRSHAAALVLTRYYSPSKRLTCTELEIRSPYLRKALKEVVQSYPGIDFDPSNKICIQNDEAYCLFHYRKELEAYAKSSAEDTMQKHMNMLLQYVERRFHREIARFDATVERRQATAGSEFNNLWVAYKPGDLMYQRSSGGETLAILVSVELVKPGRFDDDDDDEFWTTGGLERWEFYVKRVKCNGTHIGYVYDTVVLKKYEGFAAYSTLDVFPLHFHPESQRIKDRLLHRGKKYVSLMNIHHCQYEGPARLSRWSDLPTTVTNHLIQTGVRQRIMVDFYEFYQNCQGTKPNLSSQEDILAPASSDIRLRESDYLICDHEIMGYTLISKRWGFFQVDLVQPVRFNDEALQNLVLAEDKKQLISSLIMSRNLEGFSSDDFIQGKGKGVIILLHGPTGVGKTFTAEAMADYTRRPLLTANSGQFVGHPPQVENVLSRLLHLAERWQALLLLDEADVFMQARNLSDLERNGLVSMLLRILEYFEGTLFLTTNRVGTIDSAFMSRIHLALSYKPLTKEAKRLLWNTWITRACRGERPAWVDEKFLEALSDVSVSGRDIKNIALLAQAVAKSGRRDMIMNDIWKGVTAMTQFQEDFKKSVSDEGLGRKDEEGKLSGNHNSQSSISWVGRMINSWSSRS